MGNSQYKTISEYSVKKENLFETINAIATKYILTQDFQDMKKLVSDQEYCDNLVILTTKIIQEHVNIDDKLKNNDAEKEEETKAKIDIKSLKEIHTI